MKTKYFEDVLALAASILVLVAVSFAASSALADETGPADSSATTISDTSRAIAESANTTAVEDAIVSANIANRLDLDNNLLDRTSLMARD